MKKWFALALALVTMMMGSLALAEEVPAADPAQDAAALEELKAEGQLIQGESFEFYIPADWTDVELNDEQAAEGYVYAACSADEAQGLSWYGRNWMLRRPRRRFRRVWSKSMKMRRFRKSTAFPSSSLLMQKTTCSVL